jgi:ribosomal protein L13E
MGVSQVEAVPLEVLGSQRRHFNKMHKNDRVTRGYALGEVQQQTIIWMNSEMEEL